MKGIAPLETNRLRYCLITDALFDDVKATINDPVTCENIYWFDWPLTGKMVKAVCDKAQAHHSKQDGLMYLSYIDDKPAGHVGIYFDEDGKAAEIGYWVAPDFRRQGLATEMALGACAHIFEHSSAEEIYATADPNNEGSHAILTKCGLVRTGFKDSPRPDGSVRKSALFTLKRSSWTPSS